MSRPAFDRRELLRARGARPFDGHYEVMGRVELTGDEAEEVERQIAQADAEHPETHVSLRWKVEPVQVIRRAAEHAGVPYQTFIKQAAYNAAINQLRLEASLV